MGLIDSVKITTDSCVDLSMATLLDNNIGIAYTRLSDKTTREEYRDREMSNAELFGLLEEGHNITTSSPNAYEYAELFREQLKDYEQVIHLGMSQKMSSANQNANLAREEVDKNRITVIDTGQVSMGIALIVLNSIERLKDASQFDELLHLIEAEVSSTEMSVILSTAKYALKGGRLKSTFAKVAEMAGLKYVVRAEDGEMIYHKNATGKISRAAINNFGTILEDFENIDSKRIVLGTTSDTSDLGKIITGIPSLSKLPESNIERVQAGTTIASYCGPNAIAMAYRKKR